MQAYIILRENPFVAYLSKPFRDDLIIDLPRDELSADVGFAIALRRK